MFVNCSAHSITEETYQLIKYDNFLTYFMNYTSYFLCSSSYPKQYHLGTLSSVSTGITSPNK